MFDFDVEVVFVVILLGRKTLSGAELLLMSCKMIEQDLNLKLENE